MKEFIAQTKVLKVKAKEYLHELIEAQDKAPKHFHNYIVSWDNGITVDYIDVEDDRVFAYYRIDCWDHSSEWCLDITDRTGLDKKLLELQDRIDKYLSAIKKKRIENEAKEKAEFDRLSKKFTSK